ncbi:c-5 sterol desaturase [Bachmanniomyces sp. S44760]|nr:c-5 sterol desaturase [Bachmanniomyces sp. S44760]
MDVILEIFDTFFFDKVYAEVLPASSPSFSTYGLKDAATSTFSSMRENPTTYPPATVFFNLKPSPCAYMSMWRRDNIWRQALTLYAITWLFGIVIYYVFAGLSYFFIFDHATFTHPKYLKHQVSLEMKSAMTAIPLMAVLTVPVFLAEVRGLTKLYDALSDAPFPAYNYIQFPFFILFTDFFIYLIHRGLHHPWVYKKLHKPHHKWIMPTPFASHAFHPVDGFLQSVPYHVFPFLFPLQKFAYIALFLFINIWTVLIHDGEYATNSPILNGAACHTMHHLYFNYNYGQFTTLWDRLGGSYRQPNEELFSRESKMSKSEWERQSKEMESIVKGVEGDDDRSYGEESSKIQKKML